MAKKALNIMPVKGSGQVPAVKVRRYYDTISKGDVAQVGQHGGPVGRGEHDPMEAEDPRPPQGTLEIQRGHLESEKPPIEFAGCGIGRAPESGKFEKNGVYVSPSESWSPFTPAFNTK